MIRNISKREPPPVVGTAGQGLKPAIGGKPSVDKDERDLAAPTLRSSRGWEKIIGKETKEGPEERVEEDKMEEGEVDSTTGASVMNTERNSVEKGEVREPKEGKSLEEAGEGNKVLALGLEKKEVDLENQKGTRKAGEAGAYEGVLKKKEGSGIKGFPFVVQGDKEEGSISGRGVGRIWEKTLDDNNKDKDLSLPTSISRGRGRLWEESKDATGAGGRGSLGRSWEKEKESLPAGGRGRGMSWIWEARDKDASESNKPITKLWENREERDSGRGRGIGRLWEKEREEKESSGRGINRVRDRERGDDREGVRKISKIWETDSNTLKEKTGSPFLQNKKEKEDRGQSEEQSKEVSEDTENGKEEIITEEKKESNQMGVIEIERKEALLEHQEPKSEKVDYRGEEGERDKETEEANEITKIEIQNSVSSVSSEGDNQTQIELTEDHSTDVQIKTLRDNKTDLKGDSEMEKSTDEEKAQEIESRHDSDEKREVVYVGKQGAIPASEGRAVVNGEDENKDTEKREKDKRRKKKRDERTARKRASKLENKSKEKEESKGKEDREDETRKKEGVKPGKKEDRRRSKTEKIILRSSLKLPLSDERDRQTEEVVEEIERSSDDEATIRHKQEALKRRACKRSEVFSVTDFSTLAYKYGPLSPRSAALSLSTSATSSRSPLSSSSSSLDTKQSRLEGLSRSVSMRSCSSEKRRASDSAPKWLSQNKTSQVSIVSFLSHILMLNRALLSVL